MRQVVLVNGVPASGKSTVTRRLTADLTARGIPAVPLALDRIKEALFAQIGTGDRMHNRMLGRASYQAIFDTVAAFPESLLPVIDAWHGFQPVEVLLEHLARAEIGAVVELWVAVPPDLAAERYRARAGTRPPGHLPASYAEELRALAAKAEPMGIGPVIPVDGAGAWDDGLAARVAAALGRSVAGDGHAVIEDQDGSVPG